MPIVTLLRHHSYNCCSLHNECQLVFPTQCTHSYNIRTVTRAEVCHDTVDVLSLQILIKNLQPCQHVPLESSRQADMMLVCSTTMSSNQSTLLLESCHMDNILSSVIADWDHALPAKRQGQQAHIGLIGSMNLMDPQSASVL